MAMLARDFGFGVDQGRMQVPPAIRWQWIERPRRERALIRRLNSVEGEDIQAGFRHNVRAWASCQIPRGSPVPGRPA
jgi:hypothetical protein